MLILTRNPGQAIMINDDITIRYLKIKKVYDERYDKWIGSQIVLGIDCPENFRILREELYYNSFGE